MSVFIPSPNIHADVAINQHLVPQCYMREWSYNGGKSVWIYKKKEQLTEDYPEHKRWKIESKSTKKINALDNFHDLKAGSPYLPEEAMEEIYGFLLKFDISIEGETIDTLEKINQHYFEFENWNIADSDGRAITADEKKQIALCLKESRYTYIETEWAKTYENNWRTYITAIEQKVRNLKASVLPEITEPQQGDGISKNDIELLMKYLIIYDWRSFQGNEYFNQAFEYVESVLPELRNIEIPESSRLHPEDTTVMEEIKHNIRLKYFIDFLKNDTGMIRTFIEMYKENLEICFYLTDSSYPFITSNTPAFIINREDGLKEHVLVALPTMLIALGRGAVNQFIISNLNHEEVDYYNKKIANHGDILIVPSESYDVASLLH